MQRLLVGRLLFQQLKGIMQSASHLEKIFKEKTSSLSLLDKCLCIILLIISKSTHKKGNRPPQVISTDLFTHFSGSGIGKRFEVHVSGSKSMSYCSLTEKCILLFRSKYLQKSLK